MSVFSTQVAEPHTRFCSYAHHEEPFVLQRYVDCSRSAFDHHRVCAEPGCVIFSSTLAFSELSRGSGCIIASVFVAHDKISPADQANDLNVRSRILCSFVRLSSKIATCRSSIITWRPRSSHRSSTANMQIACNILCESCPRCKFIFVSDGEQGLLFDLRRHPCMRRNV